MLTRLGAKRIQGFKFSPGATADTFGLFTYKDKDGKFKEAINAPSINLLVPGPAVQHKDRRQIYMQGYHDAINYVNVANGEVSVKTTKPVKAGAMLWTKYGNAEHYYEIQYYILATAAL